jgi:hypothetical protein
VEGTQRRRQKSVAYVSRTRRAALLVAVAASPLPAASAASRTFGPTAAASGAGAISALDATFRHTMKHYRLSLSIDSNPQRGPRVLLTIELSKRLGIATQLHDYVFKLPAFDCATTLSFCTGVSTGHRMGVYGRLALRFVPRGPTIARPLGLGNCTGKRVERRGTLVGRIWFKPHNPALPGYRGRLRLAARATSLTVFSCPPYVPRPTCHVASLGGVANLSGDSGTAFFQFARSSDGSRLPGEVHFGFPGNRGAWTVGHTLLYDPLPVEVFRFTPDLSTANVDATGLPYLAGSLSYASDGKPPPTATSSCGTGRMTSGTATGDLVVQFDGLPPMAVPPVTAVLGEQP